MFPYWDGVHRVALRITPSYRMSLKQFIVAIIGMSLRQVILAVTVGVLLAVLVLWLAPELVH